MEEEFELSCARRKLITHNPAKQNEVKLEGAGNHSIKLHSTQPIKEINFFHFVDFHFVLLNEMEGIKMYYNSNLYEADSYLVIINEIWWN